MDFDTYENSQYLMTNNSMAVGLNMPPALKSKGSGENEIAHGLPVYAPRRAFLVDEYPACPANWERSKGRVMSYFVPIKLEHGLWLDFNASLLKVSQHVAVIASSQGVNVLTRLPTPHAALEQYVDNCPKHKKPFGPHRHCVECGFTWPKQNYITSAAQPNGTLWIDGFRSEDGMIRQYVFTKDQARSVAKAILGDARVFALGISFFLSKTQRPAPPSSGRRLSFAGDGAYTKGIASGDTLGLIDNDSSVLYDSMVDSCSLMDAPEKSTPFIGNIMKSANVTTSWSSATKGSQPASNKISKRLIQDDAKGSLLSASAPKGRLMSAQQYCGDSIPKVSAVQVQQVEIAAGAKVNQRFYDDPNPIDFYQQEPTAVILINYCLEEDAKRIIEAGRKPLSKTEGWPEGLKVGN